MVSTVGMILSVSLSAVIAVIMIATRYLIPELFINDAVCVGMAEPALLSLVPYQMAAYAWRLYQCVRILRNLSPLLVCTSRFGWTLGEEGMWLGLTAGMFFGSIVSFVNICKINWKDMAHAARMRTS
ncbi:unnamed protein product [Peronospora effusa]|nr:unnamed protein product [Peronospora effusa]